MFPVSLTVIQLSTQNTKPAKHGNAWELLSKYSPPHIAVSKFLLPRAVSKMCVLRFPIQNCNYVCFFFNLLLKIFGSPFGKSYFDLTTLKHAGFVKTVTVL